MSAGFAIFVEFLTESFRIEEAFSLVADRFPHFLNYFDLNKGLGLSL
jgi:hypothetical protein